MRTFYIPLAVGVGAASLAISAAGKFMQGQASKEAAKARARFLENEAVQVKVIATRETRDEERSSEINLARSRAVFAASGVEVGGSNALSFLSAIRTESEIRKGRIKRDAIFRSTQLRLRAKAERKAGKAAGIAGSLGAVGTLIGGGSKLLSLGGGTGSVTDFSGPGGFQGSEG